MKRIRIHRLTKKEDSRGWLLKMLMNKDISGNKEFGEIYITTAHPGIIKGGHYHKHTTEWFCVIKGKGKLILLNKTNNEKQQIIMGEDNMITVEIMPNIIHAIKNIGEGMMYLLAYSDKPYDLANPDIFPYDINF